MTWMSKAARSDGALRWGAAHYIEPNGKPWCARLTRRDGTPALAPFKASWVPLDRSQHLCSLCRQRHPAVCRCGRCTAQAVRQ